MIGGAFRSTSRVSITRSTVTKGTTLLGFSFESPTFPQQGMAATLGAGATTATSVQITAINKAAAAHTFPTFTTTKWASKDGKLIEGILLLPPGFDPKAPKPAPLVVFTHCGPAMAVTATHLGYGSVCARFPLAQLAEAGYLVLQPNYRGSTGCVTHCTPPPAFAQPKDPGGVLRLSPVTGSTAPPSKPPSICADLRNSNSNTTTSYL